MTLTGESPTVVVEGTDDHIRCAACRAPVADPASAVERAGSHGHTFRNPAGYSWRIRCFGDAPGCASAGELTTDASWFPGFAWCFAPCRRCGRHLGWWFVGDRDSFVALIATRISGG